MRSADKIYRRKDLILIAKVLLFVNSMILQVVPILIQKFITIGILALDYLGIFS